MGSTSTIKNIILLTAIGASSTIIALPYQINPIDSFNITPKYREIKELSESSYDYLDNLTQYDVIVNVAKKIALNSKNIDKEFSDIVNKNFWDLI